jgi:hypothetical protein
MGQVLTSFDVETQLREQLKGRLSRFPPVQFHLADEEYWLTPLKDVTDLLERERVDLLEYRGDVHDCDDFAHVLATRMIESQWQNRKRLHPHCFGEVWGVAPGGGHAINIMINDDGAVRFVEPQAEADRAVMTVDECDLTEIWMIRI